MINLTDQQRELLEDKFMLWDRAAREGNHELREYNRRAADALKIALSIVSGCNCAALTAALTPSPSNAGEA